MRLVRSAAGASLTALPVAALGVWPHLHFSHGVGEFLFFKNAYDEDIYVLFWWHDMVAAYRRLAAIVLAALGAVSGGDIDAIMVTADVVLPTFAAVCAFVLACQITTSMHSRLLIGLLLLFGQDLFSLGNVTIWPQRVGAMTYFREMFGSWGPILVPDYRTSYLSVFRTPEPQSSVGLYFLALAALVRLAKEPRIPGWWLFALYPLNLALATSYLPYSSAVLTLELGLALVLFALREVRAGAHLAGAAAVGLLALTIGFVLQSRTQGHLIYESRLPIATPAVLASVIAALMYAAWLLKPAGRSPLAWLALGLLAMPAVVSNQQILTGIMISARDWERNANYPLLVTGLALTCVLALKHGRIRPLQLWWPASALVTAMLAMIVLLAHYLSYRAWLEPNALSVAMTRALARSGDISCDTPLLLAEPDLAPLVRVRTRDRYSMVLDFTWLFEHPLPSLDAAGAQTVPSPFEGKLFEYWWRTGTVPEQAEKVLVGEIRRRGGYFISFLFSFRDSWYPATDNRLVREQEILMLIPNVIERYRHFLASVTAAGKAREIIYLSRHPPDAMPAVPGLQLWLLAHSEVMGYGVFAYRQIRGPS